MNPNSSSEMPSMQLPPPIEQATPMMPNAAEQAPAPEMAAAPPAAAAVPASIPAAGALAVAPVVPDDQAAAASAPSTASTSLPAKDDGDLIEKEWVNKAKQIVERTREDPYKQSEELTIFKADYMKQRYNKTIKLK
jgi:histone deacetylase complex regulatory component SIN3